MIKVKVTKNIIRKNTLFLGLTTKQIILALIALAVGIATFFLLKDIIDVNLLLTIIFLEIMLTIFFGLIRIQGMTLAAFLIKGLKGVDKRPYNRLNRPVNYTKSMKIPKSAQDTIPFSEVYDNGLFLVDENRYTLIFAFDNIDYALLRDSEQNETYEHYQRLLNALPTDISYQEFIMNSNVNIAKIRRALIPTKRRYGGLFDDYCNMMNNNIEAADAASSDKIMLIALSFLPQTKIDNVNTLFKYYRELQTYFNNLHSDTHQLQPLEVFKILHEFYHPFDDEEFRLPKDLYAHGGDIKDYIAPSMFAFKQKEIEMGTAFTRIMYVKQYDRDIDDGFIRDLIDNNKKITVSKHIKHINKQEAQETIRKEIFNVQEQVQKRKEKNHKSGTDFIPFRLIEKLKELEDLQERLSGSTFELFEIGIFISISEESKEALEELTMAIKAKATKHQVRIDILMRQQDIGLDTILPFAVNKFNTIAGNSVNTNVLSDAAGVLIPFSTRSYFSEEGMLYGTNATTNALIILDRTAEMNSNGFTLGSSGSGKSMFCKAEITDVLMKYPEDEVIVIDPDNEYMPLVEKFDGEILKIAADSETKMNIFDTDINYSEDGANAISMKSEFIMTVVETAKGLPLSANEKSLIDRCTKEVYMPFVQSNGDRDKLPTLTDFYNKLLEQKEVEAHDIAITLELYVKGSFNVFNGKTNIKTKKKFLVIDIFNMGEQLRTVGLQIILEYIWQRVIENKRRGIRTWVWIDEFSEMFVDSSGKETEKSGNFFTKVYKRIRKHGGVVTAITQNMSEVLQSRQASVMLANSEFVILLQQKKDDLEKIIKLFELSDSQATFLKTGEKGSGLIICGKKVIPFRKPIPKSSELYRIYNTDFREIQQAKQSNNNEID